MFSGIPSDAILRQCASVLPMTIPAAPPRHRETWARHCIQKNKQRIVRNLLFISGEMYLSCAKFFILRQFRQFRPLGESLFESSHKIFENDFFTEKHNDGNSTSNAKNNKCWKKYLKSLIIRYKSQKAYSDVYT